MIASRRLAEFIHLQGQAVPHHATADAPGSYRSLMRWASTHVVGRDSLPVFDGGSASLPYDRATLYAFRAWHDSLHIQLQASFTLADELRVAREHLRVARAAGLGRRDLRLLRSLVEGQVRHYYRHGSYIADQAAYTAACLRWPLWLVNRRNWGTE